MMQRLRLASWQRRLVVPTAFLVQMQLESATVAIYSGLPHPLPSLFALSPLRPLCLADIPAPQAYSPSLDPPMSGPLSGPLGQTRTRRCSIRRCAHRPCAAPFARGSTTDLELHRPPLRHPPRVSMPTIGGPIDVRCQGSVAHILGDLVPSLQSPGLVTMARPRDPDCIPALCA